METLLQTLAPHYRYRVYSIWKDAGGMRDHIHAWKAVLNWANDHGLSDLTP